ncbi:MAG: arabinose efflux permease family protein [Ilumatobacteraceae bacterium]|nr:arabinose efflux permease family protein [Ilumatobacteraceae bacterium]
MPRTRYAVVLITVSVGTTLMGGGLLGSLMGVRAERDGISAGAMGLTMAMYYVGFVAGMPAMNRLLEVLSRRRMYAAATIVMGLSAFGYGLAVNPLAWVGLRFVTGFCLAGVYLVVETWLNDLAHNEVRGQVMGLYVAVVAAGLVAGQAVLPLTDPSSWTSFAVAGAIMSLAWTPLLVVTNGAGVRHSRSGMMSLGDVARAVPSGVIGYLLVGLTQGCLLTMASVYAARAGLNAAHVGIFVGAITAGAVVLQMPIGAIGDRMSRRAVMVALCSLTVVACLVLMVVDAGTLPAYALAFLVGGFSTPLYALGNAYTHDWLPEGQVVAASSALLITYSVGAVFGPLLAAAAMTMVGVNGFFWALVIGHGGLAAFMVYRLVVAPDPVDDPVVTVADEHVAPALTPAGARVD